MVGALDRLHGDDDQVVPFSVGGQASAALIEGATLKVCPGASHGITYTHKEQLANDLLDFLNSSGDVTELVGASTGKENA